MTKYAFDDIIISLYCRCGDIWAEHILFLDETNVTPDSPYFCLAGIVIERKEYENILIPRINKVKELLGNPHIVFHYTDMKKSRNDFEMLQDGNLRSKFWNEIKNILNTLDMCTVGSYFNKVFYENNFPKNYCKDSYLIIMQKLLSNYVHFLHKNKSKGSIVCESRNLKEDALIQKSYFEIMSKGTDIFDSDIVKKYLTTLNFSIKKDNCIGLQIADIIPLTFMRHIQGLPDNYNLHQILSAKLYDGDIGQPDVFGLTKIF